MISKMVESNDHETLESFLHQATKVERGTQRRKDFQRHFSCNSSHKEKKEEEKTYQGKYSKDPCSSSKDSKPSSSKDCKTSSTHAKTRASPSSLPKPKIKEKISSLKCFKCLGYGHKASYCPNQRVIVLKNGEVEFEHSSNSTPLVLLLLQPLVNLLLKILSVLFSHGKETYLWRGKCLAMSTRMWLKLKEKICFKQDASSTIKFVYSLLMEEVVLM